MTLQEALFERLASRYERAGLEEPPFRSARLDEALSFMKQRLDDAERQPPPIHRH